MSHHDDKIPEAREDDPIELESQFILRLPPVPAAMLRAAVQSGCNLRERLTVQLESDLRNGKVRFDGWTLPGKVVDLPTIIESYKTLDKKTFYKTADVCQMMICKDEIDASGEEEDLSKLKGKEREKKFLWPHGITAPLKNARKKRFRKTLRKKFADVPEIEKEVRRLFRTDFEASSTRFEVVNADEDKLNDPRSSATALGAAGATNSMSNLDALAEHELFGDLLSSSDEEDTRAEDTNDDSSRLSAAANFPPSASLPSASTSSDPRNAYITEFPRGLSLQGAPSLQNTSSSSDHTAMQHQTSGNLSMPSSAFDFDSSSAADAVAALEQANASEQDASLISKMKELEQEIRELQSKRRAQENEIAGIENAMLRQRFQSLINSYTEQEAEKQRHYDELCSLLGSKDAY